MSVPQGTALENPVYNAGIVSIEVRQLRWLANVCKMRGERKDFDNWNNMTQENQDLLDFTHLDRVFPILMLNMAVQEWQARP